MAELTATESLALWQTAIAAGVDPGDLARVIQYESGFDPMAKNPDPASTARGLIQFIDATAQGMGYRDSLDLVTQNPSIEQQLSGPVREYLIAGGPYLDSGDLWLQVFYPAAREWPRDQQFPWDVQEKNPDIRTPQDYINRVRAMDLPGQLAGIGIAAILGVGMLVWLILRDINRRKSERRSKRWQS
jgi:hypothetical protein